jgi:tRNA (guanine-N7-)-methyltransferase
MGEDRSRRCDSPRREVTAATRQPHGAAGSRTDAMARADEGRRAKRVAFFGRRQGHKLGPRQAALFESLLPRLALDLTAVPGDLSSLFSPKVDSVRLEIGFGSGEYLLAEAQLQPRTGFIGVEPFVNGMAKALSAIEARKLVNIRLHHGDAIDVMDWLPAACLAGVDLVYPDPWPKRKHWKRRFVQDASLAEIARILQPAAAFRFVTDVPDYAAWTLERGLRARHLIWTAERADDWRLPWRGFTGTRYEAKAKGEGRCPCYLIFRKADDGRQMTEDG